MTESEKINGWTFEETVKTAENLMKEESNMFKWDVLRHLRDFAETYKDKVQQFEAIGTIEEFKALKQWKSDIIESFSKYDVNSVDELRASVIDKFMEAFLTKAMEASEKAIFDGGLVCDVLTLDCASDMVLEIALDMKGEKE